MAKLSTLKYLIVITFFLLINHAIAQVPVAKFGPNKILYCEQYGSVQLFDSSTNSPYQWEWNVYDSTTYNFQGYYPNLSTGEIYSDPNGNGNNEFSKNPEFAFDIPGTYSVRMRSRNSTGWSNWVVKKICIKVQRPTTYILGYGVYGANNDNIVDSDTGTIMDDGGMNLNYSNNQGQKTKSFLYIKPCKADKITLIMTQLKFADVNDKLNVYDGDFIGQNNLLVSWTSNNTSNKTVVANSGKMLILFSSNASGVDSGYYGTYSVLKDTSLPSATYNFDIDSPYYNSTPARFKVKVTNPQGIPETNWSVDATQVPNNTKENFNYTFFSDGTYNICLKTTACDEIKNICKSINVVTPNTKTSINFKTRSFARYSYDSVFLIPETDNANRFEWTIQPTSYMLINPPQTPSSFKPGQILVNANPGDSIYIPRISFLDTVCYTIKLKAYNSLNKTSTVDSLTKTNYVCASDFRNIYGVFGSIYNDINNNCQLSVSEPLVNGIPVKLYDNSNQLIGTTYTFYRGLYRFDKTSGTYKIKIDLTGSNISANCATGIDSIVTISSTNKMGGVDFAVSCNQNQDLGVETINTSGWVFPGQTHILQVVAGDILKKLGGINCNGSVSQSGTVRVELIGKATIKGADKNAYTPNSNNGKIVLYNISSYNSVDIYNAFKLKIKVDTNAQSNDTITIKVRVSNSGSDVDTNNNFKLFKYLVRNSYDPNEKEVYPIDIPPLYNDWLTYTIHFQNTGSAPAFNIRLADTLDANLDIETFTVLNASHDKRVSLKGRALNIYFDDIMLPDSFTDKEGSKGFFQYKIKPINGLTKGNKIKNTAYIYFDYNTPVVTNTTVNEYVEKNNSIIKINEGNLMVYPNPSNGMFKLEYLSGEIYTIEVFNSVGSQINLNQSPTNETINLSLQAEGIYTAKVYTSSGVYFVKLIRL